MTRLGLGVFFTLNVMVFAVTLWTYDLYNVSTQSAQAAIFADLLRYFCLLVFIAGLPAAGATGVENGTAGTATEFVHNRSVADYRSAGVFRVFCHCYY